MNQPASFPRPPPARSWRSLALAFVLLGGVGLLFLFGAAALGLHDVRDVEPWIGGGVRGPWALPAAVVSFAVLAFLGVPQFVLIAAAALAFGPWLGALYSWVGTLVSAVVGFGLGRRFGERLLRGSTSRGVARFTELIARNGFLASLVVRLVPSAPFIVVNMAAGATSMSWAAFAAGSAVGIVPKIALTAFAGQAALRGLSGRGAASAIWLAGAAVVWIGATLAARAWLKRRRSATGPTDQTGGA